MLRSGTSASIRPARDADWFPSRLDLRVAKRRERIRAAVFFNLFFLCAFLVVGGPEPLSLDNPAKALVELFFLFAMFLFASTLAYSFVGHARREQLEKLKGNGTNGCHVHCRFFDGAFELGRDWGWLGRDGARLRFEGTTTRFVIGVENLSELVEGEELLVDVRGRPIRIKVVGETSQDKISVIHTLQGWPKSEAPSPEFRLPPSTPQPRTYTWYARQVLERTLLFPAVSTVVCQFGQLLIPIEYRPFRTVLIFVPLFLYLAAFLPLMIVMRRREEAIMAALAATKVDLVQFPGTQAGLTDRETVTA